MSRIIQRFQQGTFNRTNDVVAPEEPMEIRIEGRPVAVLMRSPGDDIDLTIGFLCTEGVIEDVDDIQAIAHIIDPQERLENTVDTILASGVPAKRRNLADRNLFASSSCGICGKASLDRIFIHSPPLPHHRSIPEDLICSLPVRLLQRQQLFAQTGGLHAAGLFTIEGEQLVIREDIGRHNAVDKTIGHCLQQQYSLDESILVVSGRVGFEIAQKALVARIPIIVAIGAPSSLAVDICQEARITLFGFVKNTRFNQYTGF